MMRCMLALAVAATVAAVPSDPKAAAAALIKQMVSDLPAYRLAPFFVCLRFRALAFFRRLRRR